MKKILLALCTLPVLAFGQGSQNFESVSPALPTSYSNGSFTDGGITYTYGHSRDQDTSEINGVGLMLRRASDSYLEFTIPNGVGTLSFDYRKAFSGNGERQLMLIVNGDSLTASPIFGTESGRVIHSFSHNISLAGSVTIKIKNIGSSTSNKQITLDNIVWTAYTPSVDCGITAAGLTALTCNDNGTGAVTTDDYLTFSLNPTGANLGSNGYTVSVSSGTITPTTGVYGAATSFQLQAGSAGSGNVVVTITDADSTSCSFNVTIEDQGVCSSANPVITTSTTTLNTFTHMVGVPSASQNFTVSGLSLTADIVVTAPADFEVSLDNSAFNSTVSIAPTTGTVAPTQVYVRGNASTYGAYAGDIIISSIGADNDTVAVTGFANDYIHYTIDQINGLDANGVPDSMNVLVTLTGVVQCQDFRAAGYSFAIIDASNKGINVFSSSDINGYEPTGGDSVRVKGKVTHFRGLLQLETTSIELLSQNAQQTAPVVVTALDESTENMPVTLENVTVVDPEATNNVFPTNNSVIVTNGTTEFTLRSVTPDLAGQSLPIGPFNVTGIGSQFNNPNSAPFNNGYQLNICGIDAITIPCTGTNVPNTNVNVNGATLSAVNATGYTYQWINCEDNSEIANATTRTFTATENGSYAVVIENALGCSDTSDCIVIDNVSVASVELMNAVAAYPNPVNDQLTIKNYGDSQVDFVITDINGKVVVERSSLNSETVINTVNWSKGVYFVNMTGVNNASVTLKVIK